MALFKKTEPTTVVDEKIKLRIYAMRDKLSGYQPAIPFVNDEVAIRYFKTQCLENPTIKNQPGDFEFYYIGEYDTARATFLQPEHNELIAKGENYVSN